MTWGMRVLRLLMATLPASALLAGCASDGSTHGYVSYGVGYGYGYYDPWYRHDVIVRPPPVQRPPDRPVRPTPLPARPLPARPIPRPAPMGRLR
jgi:hypothetical protein